MINEQKKYRAYMAVEHFCLVTKGMTALSHNKTLILKKTVFFHTKENECKYISLRTNEISFVLFIFQSIKERI